MLLQLKPSRASLILGLLLLAHANAFLSLPENKLLNDWISYKKVFGKIYDKLEDVVRKEIFAKKLIKTVNHNILYKLGQVTYKMGVNSFTDMTNTEIARMTGGYVPSNVTLFGENMYPNVSQNYGQSYQSEPDSWDWRKYGAVTGIKAQGECGACWSFVATGALEAQFYFKYSRLISLSEQNLIDCVKKHFSSTTRNGCNGGHYDRAFYSVLKDKGIEARRTYPYIGMDTGPCNYKPEKSVGRIDDVCKIREGEENLKNACYFLGPIAVSIHATENFVDYESGIFSDPSCSSTELNHGVLVIGYGVERGTPYWLIKNSWGTDWGEGGYGKMIRNKNNNCGIATDMTSPGC